MSRGIVPAVPRGQQIAQGLLSGSTLLLVAVGVPVVLVLVGGSPVPHGLVHAVRVDMSLRQLFGKPVEDTWIVHAAFALAWCAWLWLSVCVVVEMVSWVSGRTPVRVPGSRAMQAVAACLVGTTLAVMSANRIPGPGAHVSARASAAATSSTALQKSGFGPTRFGSTRVRAPGGARVVELGARSSDADVRLTSTTNPRLSPTGSPPGTPRKGSRIAPGSTVDLPNGGGSGSIEESSVGPLPKSREQSAEVSDLVEPVSAPPMRTYVVQPHDTLWSIAGSQLGSPLLWPEIAQANYGRPQPDGGVLTDAHWIDPGWVLILPADASMAEAVSPSVSSAPAASAAPAAPGAPGAPGAAPRLRLHLHLQRRLRRSCRLLCRRRPRSRRPRRRRPRRRRPRRRRPRRRRPGAAEVVPPAASKVLPSATAQGWTYAALPALRRTKAGSTVGASAGRQTEGPDGGTPWRFPADSDRRRAAWRRICGHHRSDAPRPAAASSGGRAHQAAPSGSVELGAQAADQR